MNRINEELAPQENGESIAFRAIRDPQLAVVDAILAKTPRTMADIAWQLEAAIDGAGVNGDDWMETLAVRFHALAADGGLS